MALDIIVLSIYIILIIAIGLKYSGTGGVKDYFLGNKSVPWLMACFSIVATETSTLTFLSVPGLAYTKGFSFLQMTFGYLVGRILVSIILLPGYFKGNFETAYHFLQKYFGNSVRILMAIIFHITRLLADSVRLFATAIPLVILTQKTALPDLTYWQAILIIAFLTFIYSYYGGIKSVIIVDTIQLGIYLLCAFIGIYLICNYMDLSFSAVFAKIPAIKFNFITIKPQTGWLGIFKGYNLICGIIGGAFFSFASHGVDHLIIQRILSCKDLKSGQKAMIGSGIIIIFQFALFLLLGAFIFVLLNGQNFEKSDQVMSHFIINYLPNGVRGLMLAGIFAAAMSSLSSSINSLSASTAIDILKLEDKDIPENKKLKYSRLISLVWTIVLVLIAIMLTGTKSPLVELGLGIAGLTYGAMLGIFILAKLRIKINTPAIISGIVSGIFIIIILKYYSGLFWPWYVPVGSVFTIIISILTNKIILIKN